MTRSSRILFSIAFFGLLALGFAAPAEAQRRADRETGDLVRTLNSQLEDLQSNLEYEVSNNGGGQAMTRAEQSLQRLQGDVAALNENITRRRESENDVNRIVSTAKIVDGHMRLARATRALEGDWADAKRTIDLIASKFGVTSRLGDRDGMPTKGLDKADNVPIIGSSNYAADGLTGTFKLDRAKSENIADILESTSVSGKNRQDLESKLDAPEEIALMVRGNQVTIASSIADPVTVVADGREKTESDGSRTIRLRATLRGETLTVSSIGGETDYTLTFVSTDKGRVLTVTRRITTDYLSETIFAESVYRRTDTVAKLGIENGVQLPDDDVYSSSDPDDADNRYGDQPSVVTPRIGEFIVPNGIVLSGVLENDIDTKVSHNNDRFRLTVQSPEDYRGAIIEGYISGVGRSGQVSGRSNVTFNFTRITLTDGKAYDFAGTSQSITDMNGKAVKIDNEGTAKGDSQTKETVKRGGIGAGIGALIGAIAGGGKGAAIGAIIGGGAGAGSVAIQGRDDIKIQKGSVFSVVSSSPLNRSRTSGDN